MEFLNTVDILGTVYSIKVVSPEDEHLDNDGVTSIGTCDCITKSIYVSDMSNMLPEQIDIMQAETMRHEIIHAYLEESGLSDCSLACGFSWAANEEMIDWFAIQSPKIFKTFMELGILPEWVTEI